MMTALINGKVQKDPNFLYYTCDFFIEIGRKDSVNNAELGII